ncbi:MAG: UDP-N-acetylmuramate dehydrogenase [Alphaproteobacteria bacterium]|nr:UDP-N-acetylmuramate dehydrogenase [Alphaproteobacteria bacterium]
MMSTAENLQKLPQIRGTYKYGELLKNYTWLNVGGPAEVMFFPKDTKDLQYFLQNKAADTEVFVLGGGANLLVRDGGIKGVVIKLADENFRQIKIENDYIICGAGLLNNVLKKTVEKEGLGGLEFLCSIPGCLGGALRSNAGCFGREMSDVLQWAEVVDGNGNILKVQNKDFHFAYRYSEFPEDWIITELCLKFEKKTPETVSALITEQAEYRRTHQPQGIRTAGSTFKNPPQMRAWELIKNSGADKLKIGGAQMSPQHCNFLQNDGTASAADIENLCDEIIRMVKDKYGVRLEMEVNKVGRR